MPTAASKQTNQPDRSSIWTLALILLVSAAIRLPLLNIPFERDEGEYAYISWRMGHGEVAYRDWVDQKPPAIFWVYRLALMLPLPGIAAVHLAALIWSAASACALFYLARRFMSVFAAGAASVLFAILLADPMINGTAANTELFMLLPLILSQLVFFHALSATRRKILLIVLCGALIGLASAFKQVAVVNWPFLVAISAIFATKEKRLVGTFSFACWSALGGAGVWAVIAGYFFLRGGFDQFVYNVFTHNFQYVSALPGPVRWANFQQTISALRPSQITVWIFAGASLFMLRPIGGWKWLLFVMGWLMTSLIGTAASGYFFPHYFQQLLPALALAALLGGERISQLPWLGWAPLALRRSAFALILVIPFGTVFYPFLFKYTPAEAVQKIYPGNYFELMPELGARLAQATRPEDKVFIFGTEPELLFYAQRVSATRYIFLFPLYGPYPDALAKQRGTVEEISRTRPAAIFYSPNVLFRSPNSELYLTRWTQDYIRQNYAPDAYITRDASRVLRLRTGSPGLPPAIPTGERALGTLYLRNLRD